MERVFPHMRTRLAGADAVLRFLPLRDAVQRCAARDAHVQQHGFLSRGTRDHGFRYVCCPPLLLGSVSFSSYDALCGKLIPQKLRGPGERERERGGIFSPLFAVILSFSFVCRCTVCASTRQPLLQECWDEPGRGSSVLEAVSNCLFFQTRWSSGKRGPAKHVFHVCRQPKRHI